ncbi:hypothetical protein [Mesorhizobium sp. M1143]|uniref:hypothetical protein n=1 Tax=Mesorhizobium sp. M1143 TaxID=2957061 RepID=UPI003336852E
MDYGASKFRRHPDEIGYIGRRMDIFGRSIDLNGQAAIPAIQLYISGGTASAWHWRQKAGVGIWPAEIRGRTLWQPS